MINDLPKKILNMPLDEMLEAYKETENAIYNLDISDHSFLGRLAIYELVRQTGKNCNDLTVAELSDIIACVNLKP